MTKLDLTPLDGAPEPAVVTFGGRSLVYDDRGRGPAVMLIHGLGLCRQMWQEQQDWLASRGYRTIAPDLRGFGQSARGQEAFSLAGCADDLVALLDYLGIGRAAVCGISLGGSVLIEMLVRHPGRIAGACLVATRAQAGPAVQKTLRARAAERIETGGPEGAADVLVAPLPAGDGGAAPAWLPQVRRWVAGADRQALAEALRAGEEGADGTARASAFPRPVLVVSGGLDRMVPAAQGRHLARSFACGAWLGLPEAGHLVNLDQPGKFNACLLEFLRSLRRPGAGI